MVCRGCADVQTAYMYELSTVAFISSINATGEGPYMYAISAQIHDEIGP